MEKIYRFEPIGEIHSCYREKFGIPKQSGLVTAATARLVLHPPYNREEMSRGLDGFSHLWIIFIFHQTVEEGWKPTVRPPRLGGQRRVGVFASRSPHRPNHVGMSAVRLERVLVGPEGVVLEISGVDLLDGTPVIDIKPYVPYADALVGATGGFTGKEIATPTVEIPEEVGLVCDEYLQRTGRNLRELILQTLGGEPRPASQRTVGREYGMLLWEVNVRWVVEEWGFRVLGCSLVE